jgi:ATP-binding cassette, subfamily C, bacterial CydCD
MGAGAGEDGGVRGVDSRLLSWGRPTRIYLGASIALGCARAILLLAQAWLLATVVAGAFISGQDLTELKWPVELLLAVVILRALVAWFSERAGDLCSAKVKSMLRGALVERVGVLGPDGRAPVKPGPVATLATQGIDALDGYFSRYLPQRILAVIVPLTVMVAVLWADWISAVIMVVTVPLIPVFMALIGATTKARTARQLQALQRLSGHFLDVVKGLGTLKAFGRSKAQSAVIANVTHDYRRRLLATLRVTFLSSLVLELAASVSVALIAVSIGLRLLGGHVNLRIALFVLVLAPEAYLPLRQLGAEYHASADGVAAAEQIFDVLDRPAPSSAATAANPHPMVAGALSVDSVRYTYPERDRPAVEGLTLEVRPGEVVALTGPSGCGKSTLIALLMALIRPDTGIVRVGGVDLASVDPDVWRTQVAWVPQRPHIFGTTIEDNVRIGRYDATAAELRHAVESAGLAELIERLPRGLATVIGDGGSGLSAGERQRVALARAFLRDVPLLLLDEPTANLDGATEETVLGAIRHLVRGRTAVIAAHRPALVALADRVVDLALAEVAA